MLLITHYQLLLLGLNQNKNINIKNNQFFFGDKLLTEENIENLIKGIFYPDLPCSYFFINNNIEMKVRLCSVTKILSLGKNISNNMRSQIEESHNGRFSINHSMADHPDKLNIDIRDSIVSKCIILLYLLLTTKDYSFLGYILHIIQDSFSPVHSFREELDNDEEKKDIKKKTITQIINNSKQIKNITPRLNFIKIDHLLVSDLVYHIIDDKKNIKPILKLIRNTKKMDETKIESVNYNRLINKIIELMLDKCPNNISKKKVLNILLGYLDGKIKKSLLKNPLAEEKISVNKINPELLLKNEIDENKIDLLKDKILIGDIFYNDLSHNIRRVYKILMNSLFNEDVLSRIKRIIPQKGGKNTKSIKTFLYYPDQDQDKHAVKDCGYVQLDSYNITFNQCLNDTKCIIDFCLKALQKENTDENLINSLQDFYHYLILNTFYMSKHDLNMKVSQTNKDTIEISKTNPSFLKCSLDHLYYISINFNLKYKRILSDFKKITDDFKKITNKLNI
jgi:hypothetical protein